MQKASVLLAAMVVCMALTGTPAQAQTTPLPVVIHGTEGNGVIVFMENARLSSGHVISLWSDEARGLYFLGKVHNGRYAGLFHWKGHGRRVALVSLGESEAVKDAYPKASLGPVPLPGGLCATTDGDMIRIAPQRDPGAPGRTLTVRYDDGTAPLFCLSFMAANPDMEVRLVNGDLLGMDGSALGPDEKVDVILTSSNQLGLYRDGDVPFLALNASAPIAKAHSAYYPQLRPALVDGGRIIAVPMEIRSCDWGLDQQAWAMAGLPAFPHGLRELADLSALWEEAYSKAFPQYSFAGCTDYRYHLIANALRQYASLCATGEGPLDFNNTALGETVQSLYDSLPYEQPSWRSNDALEEGRKPLIYPYSYEPWFSGCRGGILPVFPPALAPEARPPIAAELQLALIPEDSDAQDLALRFLDQLCHDPSTAYLKDLPSFPGSNPFWGLHQQQKAMVAARLRDLQSQMAAGSSQGNAPPEYAVLRDLEASLAMDIREGWRTQSLAFAQMLPYLDFGLGPCQAGLRRRLEAFLGENILQLEFGPMGDWFGELAQIPSLCEEERKMALE